MQSIKYKKGARDFTARHTWYIPIARLMEMGCVRSGEGAVGVLTMSVAVPGHKGKAMGKRKQLQFPYFEDCCDDCCSLVTVARSGVFGDHATDEQLHDQRVLDALMA